MKVLRSILGFPGSIYLRGITYLSGSIGNRLRYRYWKKRLGHLGKKVIIDVGVHFDSPEYIYIDDHTWIDRYVVIIAGHPQRDRLTYYKANPHYDKEKGQLHIGKQCHIAPFSLINAMGGIKIGDGCGLASGSKVYSYSHHYRNLNDRLDKNIYTFSPMVAENKQAMISGSITMMENSALGLNAVILPGVHIGKNSWVATQQVVSNNIPNAHVMNTSGEIQPLSHITQVQK